MRLQNRLEGWWPMIDKTGNVDDYSSRNNSGTINGGITRGVTGILGDGAYNFNGTDGYIDTGINDLRSELNNFTISAWVRLDSTARIYLSSSLNNSNDLAIQAALNETFSQGNTPGAVKLFLRNGSGSKLEFYSDDENVDDGDWHHVVWVYQPNIGDAGIYVDGAYVVANQASTQTFSISNTFENSIPLGVSNSRGSLSLYYNGDMNDVRFYSRALPPAEVNALYERGRSGTYSSRKKSVQL